MDACNNLVVADSIAYNYVQLCEGDCWTVNMSANNDVQEWVLSGSGCFHMRDATASHSAVCAFAMLSNCFGYSNNASTVQPYHQNNRAGSVYHYSIMWLDDIMLVYL